MSRFSFSTTCSSPTSTHFSTPATSPALPISATLSPHHSAITISARRHHSSRWPPLSPNGLPRSPNPSSRYYHPRQHLHSPPTTPAVSPSTSPRLEPAPQHHSTSKRPSSTSPQLEIQAFAAPQDIRADMPEPDAEKTEKGFKRLRTTVGRGLRRCSSCFKKRPDHPDEVEEVPKPPHWSEY